MLLGAMAASAATIPPLNRPNAVTENKGVEAPAKFLADIIANNLTVVRSALEADKSLSRTKSNKSIPVVIYAAMAGPDMLALLLEYGADPNSRASVNNGVMRDYSVLDVRPHWINRITKA